jgi:hypothetical protein
MKDSTQLHNTENLYKEILPLYKEYKEFYTKNIENKNPDEATIIE